MALKPLHNPVVTNVDWFMNEVASRGGVVVMSTAASGGAMDNAVSLVTYAANPSGKLPIGVLLCDMVNKDLTQTHLNQHKNEVQIGSKVTIGRVGEWTTDMIYPGLTIAANDCAYMGPSGLLQNVDVNTVATPIVGIFASTKDEDGYAKVYVNLPMATPRI